MLLAKVWTQAREALAHKGVMKRQTKEQPQAIFAITQTKEGKGKGHQTSETPSGKRQVTVVASSSSTEGMLLVVTCNWCLPRTAGG